MTIDLSTARRARQEGPTTARMGMSATQQLFGLTARALCFYEERGLIEAGRNRSGSRFFDGRARQRLWLMVMLRRAGAGLDAIAGALDEEEGFSLARQALDEQEGRLNGQLEAIPRVCTELGGGAEARRSVGS